MLPLVALSLTQCTTSLPTCYSDIASLTTVNPLNDVNLKVYSIISQVLFHLIFKTTYGGGSVIPSS